MSLSSISACQTTIIQFAVLVGMNKRQLNSSHASKRKILSKCSTRVIDVCPLQSICQKHNLNATDRRFVCVVVRFPFQEGNFHAIFLLHSRKTRRKFSLHCGCPKRNKHVCVRVTNTYDRLQHCPKMKMEKRHRSIHTCMTFKRNKQNFFSLLLLIPSLSTFFLT